MAILDVITKHTELADTIRYVCNDKKTRVDRLSAEEYLKGDASKYLCDGKLMSGINCHAETAIKEMTFVQERFAQRHSVIECYHAVQSFKTGEVTAVECHRIGVELAEICWGLDYQVLVATHVNTDQYHNHFVINPVSMWTGKKWQFRKSKLNECRRVSDQLCMNHGLSIIWYPSRGTSKMLNRIERNGGPTKYNLMRKSINKVLEFSFTVDEFVDGLRMEGYVVSQEVTKDGDRTIRTVNNTRAVKLGTLGNYYERRLYQIFDYNDVIGDKTGILSRKKGRFYEEKMRKTVSLMQGNDNSEPGMNFREMTLADQYNELKKIIDVSFYDRNGDNIFSPECRLAFEKKTWYMKQIEICSLFQFKNDKEVIKARKHLEQIRDKLVLDSKDSLSEAVRKWEKELEQEGICPKNSIESLQIVSEKKLKDTIKILKQMEKHAPKIQTLLQAEAETKSDLRQIMEIEKYILGDIWAEKSVQKEAQKIRYTIYSLENDKSMLAYKGNMLEWLKNYMDNISLNYDQRERERHGDKER